MGRTSENERDFKAQSYFRLLRYARPYWLRLTIGILAGMKSPHSLYSEEIATFGEEDVYDQHDAEGFINLFGLPIKVRALLANKEIK